MPEPSVEAATRLNSPKSRQSLSKLILRPDAVWIRLTVASDHLRSSSYGASANRARSRHSEATAEMRPYPSGGTFPCRLKAFGENSASSVESLSRVPR
jgi:hypothetical protein